MVIGSAWLRAGKEALAADGANPLVCEMAEEAGGKVGSSMVAAAMKAMAKVYNEWAVVDGTSNNRNKEYTKSFPASQDGGYEETCVSLTNSSQSASERPCVRSSRRACATGTAASWLHAPLA